MPDTGIKRWNKQAILWRTPQSTTNWVVFRNGNWLKAETTTHRTCTNHSKSTDFCLLSSNKKKYRFPYSLEKNQSVGTNNITYRVLSHPLLLNYFLTLNIISLGQNCGIIVTANYGGGT